MAFETAWGSWEAWGKIGVGTAVVGGTLVGADALQEHLAQDQGESKPEGIARRVSPAEVRRIKRNIEKKKRGGR
jgi:hypothetical protein